MFSCAPPLWIQRNLRTLSGNLSIAIITRQAYNKNTLTLNESPSRIRKITLATIEVTYAN